MMSVQNIGCQPIKQIYKSQAFGRQAQFEEDDDPFLDELKSEKDEFKKMAENKDSKMLSTIGTLGVSLVAAALSFCTFKAVAPKGYQTLKTIYHKTTDFKPIRATIDFVKRGFTFVGGKISETYNGIKPETKLGKAKTATEGFVAKYITPYYTRAKGAVQRFAEKHNINKAWFKSAALNTGATAVSVPAAVTAANAHEEAA